MSEDYALGCATCGEPASDIVHRPLSIGGVAADWTHPFVPGNSALAERIKATASIHREWERCDDWIEWDGTALVTLLAAERERVIAAAVAVIADVLDTDEISDADEPEWLSEKRVEFEAAIRAALEA